MTGLRIVNFGLQLPVGAVHLDAQKRAWAAFAKTPAYALAPPRRGELAASHGGPAPD